MQYFDHIRNLSMETSVHLIQYLNRNSNFKVKIKKWNFFLLMKDFGSKIEKKTELQTSVSLISHFYYLVHLTYPSLYSDFFIYAHTKNTVTNDES